MVQLNSSRQAPQTARETWPSAPLVKGDLDIGGLMAPSSEISNQCDDLEALMLAAIAADESDATADQLGMLVRACADVGGARPKVRWRNREGEWIAKFPTWGDEFDDPRIEAVCLDARKQPVSQFRSAA